MEHLIKSIWRNNNFLSMLGNVAFAGIAFLSFAILARSYSTDIFGRYMLFITGGTFLEMLRFGLTRTSIVKYLAGANAVEHAALIGSNYLIGLISTLVVNILLWGFLFAFRAKILASGFDLFFIWYPWMALANLPMNNAVSLFQAEVKFERLLYVRAVAGILFLVYVVVNYTFFHLSIGVTILVQIVTQLATSLMCIAMRWDGLTHIFSTTREAFLKLLHFGKFSMGTLLSTSLLKSADTFILGLMPVMGVGAVAVYSIPLKLSELFEIPLRSFIATVFPRMSKADSNGNRSEIGSLFCDYLGLFTYLFIPLIIICEVFAPQIVLLFGGGQYAEAATIFRIYMLYGLFLPLDRLTGVTLDSLGKPRYNLYKVILLASINIVGDIIAVTVFRSLEVVALVTVINTFIGAFVGYTIVKRYLPLRLSDAAIRGLRFINAKWMAVFR